MTHAEAQSLLACIPRARLQPAERSELDAHLAECAGCRREAHVDAVLERALDPLRARRAAVLKELDRRTRGRSRRLSVRTEAGARFGWRRWLAASAAACVLGAGGYAWFHFNQEQEVQEAQALAERATPLALASGDQPTDNGPETPAPGAARQNGSETQAAPAAPAVIAALPKASPDETLPEPLAAGQARLRPLQGAASSKSERYSVRLTDGAVGLDLIEADLRVVSLGSKDGPADGLAVSLGGGQSVERLQDLGTEGKPPAKAGETDALPIEEGRAYLLRLARGGQELHYHLRVRAHQPGEFVELEWFRVAPARSEELLTAALRPRTPKAAAPSVKPPPPIVQPPLPPTILTSPEPPKRKP